MIIRQDTIQEETHQRMRYLDTTRIPKCGVGHCTRKTMNAAGLYPLLSALFILTSIPSENFLAQTISAINRENLN